jgi:hypothetical protein
MRVAVFCGGQLTPSFVCGLIDLKRQALSLLRTDCEDMRTPVALRTLSTILVAGKKWSRPDVILM